MRSLSLLAVAVALAGCSPSQETGNGPASTGVQSEPAALSEGAKFVLTTEPTGGKGVTEVRRTAKDGDEVVIVGRVGGKDKPFTDGRSSFLIVDPSLPPADCECPWDFCNVPDAELAAARAAVKFQDGQGSTLKADARELFKIEPLSTVVIRGTARRDDKGNLTIVGAGLYVRR